MKLKRRPGTLRTGSLLIITFFLLISFQNCSPGFHSGDLDNAMGVNNVTNVDGTPSTTTTTMLTSTTTMPPTTTTTMSGGPVTTMPTTTTTMTPPAPTTTMPPTTTTMPSASLPKPPIVVGGNGRFQQIAVGMHACVLLKDGTVKCWGDNGYGALGIGPLPVGTSVSAANSTTMIGIQNAKNIVTNYVTTCVQLMNLKVFCNGAYFGGNPVELPELGGTERLGRAVYNMNWLRGALPNGTVVRTMLPTPTYNANDPNLKRPDPTLMSLSNVIDLTSDYGLTASGDLYTLYASNPVPQQVSSDVAEVVQGRYHTCWRKTDGTVMCRASSNTYGQLGQGNLNAYSTDPLEVKGFKAKSLTAGELTTCAITTTDKLVCWGSLSLTESMPQYVYWSTPQEVPGLPAVAQVAIGAFRACAITKDDKVYCWGSTKSLQPLVTDATEGPPVEMKGL